MKFNLSYFEDEDMKIEVMGGNISYKRKTPIKSSDKENIDYAMNVFRYICKSLNEISNELQLERLSEKTSNDEDAIV